MNKLVASVTLLLLFCAPSWAETKPQLTGASPVEISAASGMRPAVEGILKANPGEVSGWVCRPLHPR